MRFFNQFPADIAITACADHDSRDSPLPAPDRGSSFALNMSTVRGLMRVFSGNGGTTRRGRSVRLN